LVQSVEVMRDPFGYYSALFERFADPVTLPTMNGTVVITSHPDGIKEIFAARPDTFAPFGVDALMPLLGKRSVLVVSGQDHTSRRKLMSPPFHGERMHRFGRIFQKAARQAMARVVPNVPFRMHDVTGVITLDAIVQAVFGIRDPREIAEWTRSLAMLMQSVSPAAIFMTFLQNPLFPPWKRFEAARNETNRLIHQEIQRRRAAPDEDRPDILGMLLQARFEDGGGMDDTELRDQLITLLAAGHETTATSLAWAFYWLERNPDIKARLLAEVTALGPDPDPMKVAGLPLLEAVCMETLRLYPILPDVIRKVVKPFTLRGHEIPVGVHVGVSIAAAHTNPEVFPDPHTFNPDRFIGHTFSPFQFMPFGGGARRCMGAAFAMYEMKTVLATVLTEQRLKLARTTEIRPVRRNVTMGPEGGVEMVLMEQGGLRGSAPQERAGAA